MVDEHDQGADERGENGESGVQAVDPRAGALDLVGIGSGNLLLTLLIDDRRVRVGIDVDGGDDGVHVHFQKFGERHGRRDAIAHHVLVSKLFSSVHCQTGHLWRDSPDDRRNDQHQPDHHSRKVRAQDGIDDDEQMLVPQFPETEEHSGREEEDEHLQVKEERRPGGRLMLRDRGDDGN